MQADHRLAGPGSAGNHRHPGGGGPDRLVLLGLDGGHDVAHLVAPGSRQGGHQGALADHHELRRGRGRVQQVVFDAYHQVVAATQDPAPNHLHRLGRGGPVERFSGAGPPVDHQRLEVVVANPEPADVAGTVVGEVEPPEDQSLMLGIQDRKPPSRLVGEGIAFEQGGAVLLS